MKKFLRIFLSIVIFIISFIHIHASTDSIPKYETFTIESKHLSEKRIINVWVPEEYFQSSESLPVMYMADGGVNEDFTHMAITFSELVRSNQIPAVILVGIENTERRRDLTGPTQVESDKKIAPNVGGSQLFRAFIHDELIPVIHEKYRTTSVKGILGESLSGLFVMETFFLQPDLFDVYIAFDPSLWWNSHNLIRDFTDHMIAFPSDKKKVLWFAGSNARDIRKYTKSLSKKLTKLNQKNIVWEYADEPGEHHHTIFRATKVKALVWALNRL